MTERSIVIVGGGIIGLSIAEQLVRRGVRPVVFDRQAFASEASWASAGFLELRGASALGDAFFGLSRLSHEMYRDWTDALHHDTGLDPEHIHSRSLDLVFSDGDDRAVQEIERSLARYEIHGEWLDGGEARRREPELSGAVRRAFFLEHPAQVRPPRLNRALLALLRDRGAGLSEHTEVLGFQTEGREVRRVATARGDFAADQVVLACGAWTGLVAGRLGVALPVRPVRGQALLIQGHPGLARHLLLGSDWYVVPRRDGRLFVGSTVEDVGFVKATTPFGMQKLAGRAVEALPGLAAVPIERSWSGLRPGSADGLPFLGLVPGFDNLWIAAGHFTHGVLLAPATGRLMAQALLGERTDLDLEPFAPGRAASGS
jgi:glycine oxidase